MQRSRPLLAIALCVAPLLLAAQTPVPNGTTPAADASDVATSRATERPHSRGTRSLMGMVMAALIESAEQSARRPVEEALPQAAPDATPPAKTRAVLRQDALPDALREAPRTEVAVSADGS